MNFVRILSLSFILLATIAGNADAQTLNGPIDVCKEECYSYSLNSADPTLTYYWTVVGGNPAAHIGNSLDICWLQNTGEISVSDQGFGGSSIIDANLNILYSPLAEILDIDTGVCPTDSTEFIQTELPQTPCTKVCSGTSMTFQAQDNSGNSFTWLADGGNVVSNTDNAVVIEWGLPGFGQLELTESNGICETSDLACVEILENPVVDFDANLPQGTSGSIEICEGQEISFTSTSTGTNDFLWSVNGIVVGSNPNLNYTFEQNGVYTVKQ